MARFEFNAIATIAGLAVAAFVAGTYRALFRRIPSLDRFTLNEQRILTYQLGAMSIWSSLLIGLFLYGVWSGTYLEILFTKPVNIALAVLNWALLGFVALTSIIREVTIVSGLRIGTEPSKGRSAVALGILLIGLLVFTTWKSLFSLA